MSATAFLTFFDKADGESIHKGKEKWVEVQSWEWGVEAQSSWTKGGGASVGKPQPGAIVWVHNFDTSSHVILGYICTGKSFPKVELQMQKTAPTGPAETYFTMTLEGAFITRVTCGAAQEGGLWQRVEMVFKTVKMDYKPAKTGPAKTFNWDIPAGTASPSA